MLRKSINTLLILLMTIPCLAEASTVTLQWDPETAPDLAGYKVYYANDLAMPFDGIGAVEGPSPVRAGTAYTFSIHGLDVTQTWHFAVTAYNTAGVESPYSNIVTITPQDWTSGLPPPSGVRLTR